MMFSKKKLTISAALAGFFAAGLLSAADPVPALELDFSREISKTIRPGAALEIGKNVKHEGDALVFDGSAESYVKCTDAAFEKWRKEVETRCFSVAFRIRFDKPFFGGASNAKTASLGLFDCRLTEEGYLEVVLPLAKTEIVGDRMVLRSVDKVPYGKWVHVELIWNTNRQLYMLYIDGKFQFANDEWTMPRVAFGPLVMGDGFKGAVADFRLYDAPLLSEELALTERDSAFFKGKQAEAEALLKDVRNGHLKEWITKTAERAASFAANPARVTVAQEKSLASEIGKIARVKEAVNGGQTLDNRQIAVMEISATSQNAVLPDELPKEAKFTNHLQIAMAQDEFESAGLVIVPFRPVPKFKVSITDLKNGPHVLKASDVDFKLVKRMYRAGGAWMTYHCDIRSRVLVPDLLLNDPDLLRVDEVKRTNYLRLNYPTGTIYTDIGKFLRADQEMYQRMQFIRDAETLQAADLPEAGRNEEYIVTFRTTKDTVPGFYEGSINFTSNNGPAGSIRVTVRVLPFVLPEPKTYYDLTKTYYSHVNGSRKSTDIIQAMYDCNLRHASGFERQWMIDYMKKIGYPLKELVGTNMAGSIYRVQWNVTEKQEKELTAEEAAELDRIFLSKVKRFDRELEKWIGSNDFMRWVCSSSEASSYWRIYTPWDRVSNLCREQTKVRLFTHGFSAVETFGKGGPIDMNSGTNISRKSADEWHAVEGRRIFYAYPFPGPENPNWFRRALGLEAYLANFDGHMMHGFISSKTNDFAYYVGGDGNYRTFSLAIFQHRNKVIPRICIIGVREAYDDVRYATKLQEQAREAMKSPDALIVREAKRQLLWLKTLDRQRADMDDFRTGCQWRILSLQKLIESRAKGK